MPRLNRFDALVDLRQRGDPVPTVEFHKYQMTETLGLHTDAELIHFAVKHGLVEV
jgi:DNA-binding NarL/FixJ family response regulator